MTKKYGTLKSSKEKEIMTLILSDDKKLYNILIYRMYYLLLKAQVKRHNCFVKSHFLGSPMTSKIPSLLSCGLQNLLSQIICFIFPKNAIGVVMCLLDIVSLKREKSLSVLIDANTARAKSVPRQRKTRHWPLQSMFTTLQSNHAAEGQFSTCCVREEHSIEQ